ncbi:hypothetical protein AB7M29_005411 [Pseudomonas sp. F-14 TE3623]
MLPIINQMDRKRCLQKTFKSPLASYGGRVLSVGAAAGCDLLPVKDQDQKIAACGSSYRGRRKVS